MNQPAVTSSRLAMAKAIGRVRAIATALDDQLAEALDQAEKASQAVDRTVVVVVGEVKQGKSSLINALLGQPKLSPVDVTVTTATYLVFLNGSPQGATVHFTAGTSPIDIGVDALADWATVDAAQPVRNIDVSVDAPWLGDLVLIDTPGAGGLVAAHADAALEAAARASALLFVTDAAAPLTEVELSFLTRAAENVQTVIFALTKIGPQRAWSEVLAENKRNLAKVAPRFADARWIPVDSIVAQHALEDLDSAHPSTVDPALADADSDVAEGLAAWEESGIGELLEVLRLDLAPATAALAAANVGRAARSIAERAQRLLELRIAELEADPALEAAIEAHNARLKDLRDESRTWGPLLDKNLNLLRVDTSRDLASRVNECRDAWSERLRSMRRAPSGDALDAIFEELYADLARVGSEILALSKARFWNVADQLFEEIDDPESVRTALEALADVAPLPAPPRLPPPRPPSARDLMDSWFGFSMGRNILPIPGLSILGGLAGVAAKKWIAVDANRQADLRSAVAGWIGQAEAEIRAEVERNTIQARYYVSDGFRLSLDQRVTETQEFLEASKAARQQSEEERQTRRGALETQRRELGRATSALDQLLAVRPANDPRALR